MSTSNERKDLEAVIVRKFSHPVERVYRAWTEPKHMARWWAPAEEIQLDILEHDLREGGAYSFRYTWPEGVFPVGGKFLTVQPQECLIFSWEPREPDVDAGKETLVSVWFRALEPRMTEIELRHTMLPDELMRERHENGWLATLRRLEIYLPELSGNELNTEPNQ